MRGRTSSRRSKAGTTTCHSTGYSAPVAKLRQRLPGRTPPRPARWDARRPRHPRRCRRYRVRSRLARHGCRTASRSTPSSNWTLIQSQPHLVIAQIVGEELVVHPRLTRDREFLPLDRDAPAGRHPGEREVVRDGPADRRPPCGSPPRGRGRPRTSRAPGRGEAPHPRSSRSAPVPTGFVARPPLDAPVAVPDASPPPGRPPRCPDRRDSGVHRRRSVLRRCR